MATLEVGHRPVRPLGRLHAVWGLGATALAGMAVMAAGLGLDLVGHATASGRERALGFTLPEHFAHLVVLVGMLVALAGLIVQGRRNGRRAHPSTDRH